MRRKHHGGIRLNWKPVRGISLATGRPYYRVQLVGMPVLRLDGFTSFALDTECVTGKYAVCRANIKGLFQGIRAAILDGYQLNFRNYFSMRLGIRGAVDKGTREVSSDTNSVGIIVTPLMKFDMSLYDFVLKRTDDPSGLPQITKVQSIDPYFKPLGVLSRTEPWVQFSGNNLVANTYRCCSCIVDGVEYEMMRERSNDPHTCRCFCFGGATPWASVPEGGEAIFTFTGYGGKLSQLNDPPTCRFAAKVAGKPA